MPSGGKELVVNGLERAVSSDINRLQRFTDADRAEIFRWLMNVNMGLDDVQASSADVQNVLSTSPASGEVLGGLVVRPIIGTLGCSVDPGAMFQVLPDGDSDSSVYKFANDPGVGVGAPLLFTANSSGQTRIDVVECQWTLNANAETDNRDIFNPLTGAFVATTVPKATQGFLTYRVRAGTPGSGFPGTATGWMPLMVASIPTGFANFSTSNTTLWDVRPYVGDRLLGPANLGRLFPHRGKNTLQVDVLSVGGKALLQGMVEATATDSAILGTGLLPSLYRLGGTFNGTFDLDNTANQSGTISTGNAYIYLMEPFGLPRWAQYLVQSGALFPGNPRGIPTISMTAPIPGLLAPSSPLSMPTATGLGGTCTKAVAVALACTFGTQVESTATDGVTQYSGIPATPAFATKVLVNSSGAIFHGFYAPNTDYPTIARSVRLRISISMSVAATTLAAIVATIQVADSAFTAPVITVETHSCSAANPTGGSLAYNYTCHVSIPILAEESSFGLIVDCTGSTSTPTIVAAQVENWDVVP